MFINVYYKIIICLLVFQSWSVIVIYGFRPPYPLIYYYQYGYGKHSEDHVDYISWTLNTFPSFFWQNRHWGFSLYILNIYSMLSWASNSIIEAGGFSATSVKVLASPRND